MKKRIVTALILSMALGLTACGGQTEPSEANTRESVATNDSAGESSEQNSAEAVMDSQEEGNGESVEEATSIIDLEALNAIEDPAARYARAQEMFEEIKENADEHMTEAIQILNVMAECKAQPFGDEQYIAELTGKLDKTISACKGSYSKTVKKNDGSLDAEIFDDKGNLIAYYQHYGEANEESIRHYYDEKGNFLYSEKNINNKKEKGPSYQYDSQGRLVKATNIIDGSKWYSTHGDLFEECGANNFQMEYDSEGRISKLKWTSYPRDNNWNFKTSGGKTSQIGFVYREDGCLEKPVFDAYVYEDEKSPWVYVCSDEEKGQKVNWDYNYAYYLVDKTYTANEKRVPVLELITSKKDFNKYKLSVKAPSNLEEQEQTTGLMDGVLHLPQYTMTANLFSTFCLEHDLGNSVTYYLELKVDHTSYAKIDFFDMETALYYKVPLTLD